MPIVASIPPSGFVVGLVGLPLTAFAVLMGASTGPIGAAIAVVVLVGVVGGLVIGTRARLELDAQGLRYISGFHRTALPWSDVAGLGVTEVRGAGTWWYEILLRDGSGMRFTSAWKEGDRAAACIQRRGVAVEGAVDRRGPVRFDPETDTSDGRSDASEALGAPWPAIHRWLDVVEAELAGFGGRLDRRQLQLVADGVTLELFSVGRACLAAPEAEWPALVRAHAERIAALREQEEAFRRDARDLALVEGRLRPQLRPVDRLEGAEAEVVRAVGPHLRAFLVAALEDGEITVPRASMTAWGTDPDAILEGAARRLASDAAPAVEEHGAYVVLRGDARTAARLLDLDRHVALDARFGAVVAAPDQHVLIARPVTAIADLVGLVDLHLTRVARAAYDEGARPLTPELYWWFRGQLTHIPQIPGPNGAVSLLIPDELSGRLTGRLSG